MIDWNDIRYFERHEFGRHADIEPDEMLVLKLDDARKFAGRPFVITSGIRGPRHDGDNSAHITGHAVDIRCPDSRMRWHMLDALYSVGFRRIGIYDRHIHVDNDPTKPQDVTWVGISQ